MKQVWQRYVAWFGKLKPREQQIIALAVFIGVPFLGFTYAVEPNLLKTSSAAKTAREATQNAAGLDQQTVLLNTVNLDPDAPLRARIDQLKQQLVAQNERFQVVEKSLVTPTQMPVLLESILARSRTTQLLSLRSLPAEPLIPRKPVDPKAAVTAAAGAMADPASGNPNLFKHGFEIKVSGSYPDLVAYLAELESAPQRLIWGRMELTAEYPKSMLTLTVFTLSLDKQWLTL